MDAKRLLLNLVPFVRPKPRTKVGLFLRYAEWPIAGLAMIYFGLLLFPQVLFAHSYAQDGITVYARSPLPAEISERITGIAVLVNRSELVENPWSVRIFVCNDGWLFRLFHPRSSKPFATSAVTNDVFVARADLVRNISRSGSSRFNERTFTGVAAHETMHGLIRRRLGRIRGALLKDWVVEGYADYIAQESSFSEARGLELLITNKRDPSDSFKYFTWRKMVAYLIEEKGLSFDEIADREAKYGPIRRETIEWLRSMANSNASGWTRPLAGQPQNR